MDALVAPVGTLVDKIRVGLHRIAIVFQKDEVGGSRVHGQQRLGTVLCALCCAARLPNPISKYQEVMAFSFFAQANNRLWRPQALEKNCCCLLLCSLHD